MRELKLILLVMTVFLVIGLVAAVPIPVGIDNVEVDGTSVNPLATTRLQLENSEEFEVRIELEAIEDADDIQIEAFISGYEYSDFDPISDATHVFDVEAGTKYVKTLDLKLPENVDEGSYKLRIIVSDRNSEELIENYNLKIDAPRHSLQIKDVWFTPENTVFAGEYLIASVRLKNFGDKDEEGIKVLVNVPEMGISATDYIDELDAGDSVSSEELYLKIPRCNVKPGQYDVEVVVSYDDGHDTAPKFVSTINVESSGPCEAASEETAGKLVLNIESVMKDVIAGGEVAVFPITVTNTGSAAKTVVLDAESLDWGTLRVSPASVLVVNGGESKTAFVYLAAGKTATEGLHTFIVSVKNAEDVTLQDLTFKADVEKGTMSFARGLEVALVVLIILLVIIGLILGLRKIRGDSYEDNDEETSGETYY